MADKGAKRGLGATGVGFQPRNYPLGSPQSRAAARGVLARRFADRKRFDTIIVSATPRPCGDVIRIGEWSEDKDGTLRRTSFLPPGMSMEEAERIISERTGRPMPSYGTENVIRKRLILDV